MTSENKSILLIITGGIAAYKSLELIRLLRKDGAQIRSILTAGGAQFVTPLSVSALCEHPAYTDLWSLKDESEMGHIRLVREADLIVVAPASADFMAKMAHGLADDLASTCLLAADKPILIAPAMNHRMWAHPATQNNVATLRARGVQVIGPDAGAMACGEYGPGRMSEPEVIFNHIHSFFFNTDQLHGLKALVTAGPTFEPIDPVRFIGNRSSGKQGIAIAQALHDSGADVTLVLGPADEPVPAHLRVIKVHTAQEMLAACESALPADIAICAAAVSDWRPAEFQEHKMKKRSDQSPPAIALSENPDILKTLSHHKNRPRLVVGFAAETHNLLDHARQKLKTKGCDWIVANNVSENVFGADENHAFLITSQTTLEWPRAPKAQIARRLVQQITEFFHDRLESHKAAE
ncbi:MAG: bifunctional phosphopantothenoylcysteine decarboxylase/phosphopantothenate--cysteine ligase CoaBC [Alphaproteobacteria bacterium]|nr:bifunctional phosphopantothenoylcysteine decarboxylase/phosphopantothenate--cysteine ligase CoaBC [Alphaproteobacteria bacterium]